MLVGRIGFFTSSNLVLQCTLESIGQNQGMNLGGVTDHLGAFIQTCTNGLTDASTHRIDEQAQDVVRHCFDLTRCESEAQRIDVTQLSKAVTLLHSPIVKLAVVVGVTSRQSIDGSQEFPSFRCSLFRRAAEHSFSQTHVFVLFHLGKCFGHLGVDRFRHQSEDLACNAFGT